MFTCINFLLTLFSFVNKLFSRRTELLVGGEQALRGGVPQAAGRFGPRKYRVQDSRKPQGAGKHTKHREEGRRRRERLPQQKVGSDAGRPHGGASVSRKAGQHDDAEKAGTTPGHAKAC